MATSLQPGTYEVPAGSTLTVPNAPPPTEPPTEPPLPPGTKLADEGGTFTLAAAQRVSFGADTRWVTKLLPQGQSVCSEATFGSDPAFGTKKTCKVADAGAPTPPSPSPGPSPSPQPPSDYKGLAYDWLGPKGIAFRFGSPSTRSDVHTLTEKAVEGYTGAGSDKVYYSFGPPDYNDPNLYMTVNATVIGVPLPFGRAAWNFAPDRKPRPRTTGAPKATGRLEDAVPVIQTGSIGSETAALLPQTLWQRGGDLIPPEMYHYVERGQLSSSDPADRPIFTYRGEGSGDGPNTRTSLVLTQGSATVPAKMFTVGTVTAHNEAMTSFPLGMVPTSCCVTSRGEFALVTLWDTNTTTGKLAIVSVGEGPQDWVWDSGAPRGDWWHTWTDDMHPGHAGQGNYCFFKVIGYLDLPFTAPTDVRATTGVHPTAGTMYASDGSINGYQYLLSPMKDNLAEFKQGGDAFEMFARGGLAMVCSRSEKKVCFIDLGPLFRYTNDMYFGSAEKNAETLRMGYERSQWPYMLEDHPEAMPRIVKTFDLDDEPVGGWFTLSYSYWSKDDQEREYQPDGPFHATPHYPKAAVITKHGQFRVYSTGRYVAGVKETQPEPDDIQEIGRTDGLGDNITCITLCKGAENLKDASNDAVLFVDRANRRLRVLTWTTDEGGASVSEFRHKSLEDSRMDPVWACDVDNYHTDWHTSSVADPSGNCVRNYRWGTLKYGGNAPQWSPAECPEGGEYGGSVALKCAPYVLFASNVP